MSFAIRAPRVLMVAFLAAATAFSVGGLVSPQTADAATSQREKIVRIAKSYVGVAQYRFGAEGTHYVDCSGLVWRVYKQAGLEAKIGGARRGARSYYYWFKRRGLASRSNPKPGDLVIWRKGKHIGIYVGNGYAVSAVNTKYDVRKHKVNWLGGFTAYLHVRLNGGGGDSDDGTTTTSNYLFKATPSVNNVVVRDGPGSGHDRVATIDKGTVISVIDKTYDSRDRKWLKAKLRSGKVGWVMAEYVRKL